MKFSSLRCHHFVVAVAVVTLLLPVATLPLLLMPPFLLLLFSNGHIDKIDNQTMELRPAKLVLR